MKKYMTFFALLIPIIFICMISSCKKEEDKCKDIVCPDHGYCDIYTGECKCEPGYEGTNCDTLLRTKFIGEFQGFWNSDGVIRYDSLKIYGKPKNDIARIYIVGGTSDYSGILTGSTTFTYAYEAQTFMETTMSSEGNLKGDTLTFVYRTHDMFGGVNSTKTFIGIKQ